MSSKSRLFLVSLFALLVLLMGELLYLYLFKTLSPEAIAGKKRVVKIAHCSNLNAAIKERL